jgi:hypothetical protein
MDGEIVKQVFMNDTDYVLRLFMNMRRRSLCTSFWCSCTAGTASRTWKHHFPQCVLRGSAQLTFSFSTTARLADK